MLQIARQTVPSTSRLSVNLSTLESGTSGFFLIFFAFIETEPKSLWVFSLLRYRPSHKQVFELRRLSQACALEIFSKLELRLQLSHLGRVSNERTSSSIEIIFLECFRDCELRVKFFLIELMNNAVHTHFFSAALKNKKTLFLSARPHPRQWVFQVDFCWKITLVLEPCVDCDTMCHFTRFKQLWTVW